MKARLLTTFAALLILCATPALAQEDDSTHVLPAPPPAVEIDAFEVVGRPLVGRTFQLRVRYTAHVNGQGTLALDVPERFELSNAPDGQGPLVRPVSLREGRTRTKTFTLQTADPGASMVQVSLSAPDAPDRYRKNAYRYLNISSTAASSDMFDPRNPGDAEPDTVTTTRDENPATRQTSRTQSTQQYDVSISGKVKYEHDPFPQEFYGVYGVTARLWFRESGDGFFDWYHPVPGNQQHVHYDVTDVDGSYSFDFSFTGDLSGYDEVVVLVGTQNAAIDLDAPLNGYVAPIDGGGEATYLNEAEGLQRALTTGNTDITITQDLEINEDYGSTLRYSMLSRDLTNDVYGGSAPFEMDPAETKIEDLDDECGLFGLQFPNIWRTIIKIDPECTEASTISHEYGHRVNNRMWRDFSDYWDAAPTFKEGWAIFFSFATRNYANARYGDDLIGYDDNTEEDPFETDPTDEDGNPYRFAGMRYAYHGEAGYAAFACFLWNLYDGTDRPNFEAAKYDSGDNDDISGYGKQVFDAVINMDDDGALVSQYFDEFNGRRRSSVQEIYDFMFSDLIDVPTGNPMRPAQVENVTGQLSNGQADLQWALKSYPGGRDYGNYETGYHIYKSIKTAA